MDSEEGRGSVFTFEIPFHIGKGEIIEDVEVSRQPAKLNGLRVLLVEDNEFNIMVAIDELNEIIRNVEIEIAHNGREALEVVQKQAFDLVLMDIEMEEMNGYDAAIAIRKLDPPKGNLPIIAITANAIKDEIEKCFASGMDDHISKPFDPNELKTKIEHLIFKRKT